MYRNTTRLTPELHYRFGKRIYIIMYIAVIIIMLAAVVIAGYFVSNLLFEGASVIAVALWIGAAVSAGVMPLLYPGYKKNVIKNIRKQLEKNSFRASINQMAFEDKTYSTLSIREDGFIEAQAVLEYTKFIKAVELRDYIYLYVNKSQAFIVARNGMTEGDFDGLKVFLRYRIPDDRYIERKE